MPGVAMKHFLTVTDYGPDFCFIILHRFINLHPFQLDRGAPLMGGLAMPRFLTVAHEGPKMFFIILPPFINQDQRLWR